MPRRLLTQAEMTEAVMQFSVFVRLKYDVTDEGLLRMARAIGKLRELGFDVRTYRPRPPVKKTDGRLRRNRWKGAQQA